MEFSEEEDSRESLLRHGERMIAAERARIRSELEAIVPEVPGHPERHITITRKTWLVIINRICPE